MLTKKWLVYTSIGKGAVVERWLTLSLKVDFAVCRYHPAASVLPFAKFKLDEEGMKIPNFFKLLRLHPEILNYDYFLFADDDVVIDAAAVQHFMEEVERTGFDLAQPSLALGGDSWWRHLWHKPNLTVEETCFVEAQFFAISKALLTKSLAVMERCYSGYGADIALCNYMLQGGYRGGVIHSVQLFHPFRKPKTSVREQPWYNEKRLEIDAMLAEAFPGVITCDMIAIASHRWKKVNRFTLRLAKIVFFLNRGRSLLRKMTRR